jgi:hypothetical protein
MTMNASGPQASRVRPRIFRLLAILVIAVALIISWIAVRHKTPQNSMETAGSVAVETQTRSTAHAEPPSSASPTHETNPAEVSLATNAPLQTEPGDPALRARINELEAELASMEARLTNSATNDMSLPTGTWICTNINAIGPVIRQITISSSGPSGSDGTGPARTMKIHAWENDVVHVQFGDWGEVPLVAFETTLDGQPSPFGYAEFTGGESQGGFYHTHRLYLTVRFEPPGIWTGWGQTGDNTNVTNNVGLFSEEYMVPAN